ncbi:hypothetical protein G9A89_004368 [Geosiphon pyriformis]|nr:hypothetical protein G9A89_004368 [Geosiphon pyriformis]
MNAYLSTADRSDPQVVFNLLTSFLADPKGISALALSEKSELVNYLLGDLDKNGVQKGWNSEARLLALQTLKTLGRDPNGSDNIFADKGFCVLLTHAQLLEDSEALIDTTVSQEALTCIANALLLKDETRDLFEKYKGVATSTYQLQRDNLSLKSQFLFSRILFLMTVRPSYTVQQLINQYNIIDILAKNISTHVKELSSPGSSLDPPSPFSRKMILSEQLKLLFNLMLYDSQLSLEEMGKNLDLDFKFETLLEPVLRIITHIPPPSPLPLAPPHSHAIHALLNFPVEPYKSMWFPPEKNDEQYILLDFLIETLDSMIYLADKSESDEVPEPESNKSVDFDEVITPLAALLKKLAEDGTVKLKLRSRLLPDNIDRSKPLVKGQTLNARLIRLLTSVMYPNLRDSVSELLYILCDEDAQLLIYHVGYGNAAGYLMKKNILIPPKSVGNSRVCSGQVINPITGQYYHEEPPPLADMTEEEKEREAEKLFVLFERLNKTGVISVLNPLEQAIQSGKLKDLEDEQ